MALDTHLIDPTELRRCVECAAVVLEPDAERHQEWHVRLDHDDYVTRTSLLKADA